MSLLPLPSIELLNELLEYNPDTGVLRWKVSRGGHIRAGKVAGGKEGSGYIHIMIMKKAYKAHRVIWKMVYGNDPDVDKVIDHINQVRDDNRICNLRCVSPSENILNKSFTPGITGISNITWEERNKAYRVRVSRKHIGYCKTLEEAKDLLQRYNDDEM